MFNEEELSTLLMMRDLGMKAEGAKAEAEAAMRATAEVTKSFILLLDNY